VTIKESRLMDGTLTLGPDTGAGAIDISCQITNALIKSSYDDDGDPVTVLCGETKPAPRKLTGRRLEGTIIQDFDYPESAGGIIDYLWNHDLEVVAFSYTPDSSAAVEMTGTVQLEVPEDSRRHRPALMHLQASRPSPSPRRSTPSGGQFRGCQARRPYAVPLHAA
jgi:hypothetical protein